MFSATLSSAVLSISLLAGAPPAEAPSSEGALIQHSDREDRAAAAVEAFAADVESCPNDAGTSALVIPVVDRGALYGYAFVTPRLCLARGVNAFSVTDEMHFIVDGMIRAAHRTPISLNADLTLNKDAANAAMLAAARSIIGESRIERLDLLGDDFRPVR
jgi:hypothetical protein